MKKRKSIRLFGPMIAISIIIILFAVYIGNKEVNSNVEKIRIGWQTPWATQGQLTGVLKHTNFLKENGLDAEFVGFNSGGPLNEAALAGRVDVLFTADQPAATLLSKSDDWVIVGRLMYNRVSLYVPPNSEIKNITDLKGKTVAMPFGAAAQRMALKAEKDAGLDPAKDVNNINLDIYTQSDLVRDSNASKWGSIDAMAGFDPTPAIFEVKGLVRYLKVDNVVSVIVFSKNFINKHPGSPENFLRAFIESYNFYRQNIGQADSWFEGEANLNITSNALAIAASVEPNLNATSISGIRVNFTSGDYRTLQDASDFLFENKMINKKVNMSEHVNLSYLEIAQKGVPR